MDLEELYKCGSISEQRYTNVNQIYWHGSYLNDLDCLKAYPLGNEKVPLAWVSLSVSYAASYAIPRENSAIYHLRQLKTLNIWNPLADKDWNALATKYPEYCVDDSRKFLSKYDWINLRINIGRLRVIKRDDLLAAIQALNMYDGVFNRESWSGAPCLGIFSKSVNTFGIVNRYDWDNKIKMWRCISQPRRCYDPSLKKMVVLKESDLETNNLGDIENGRQNFLERPI